MRTPRATSLLRTATVLTVVLAGCRGDDYGPRAGATPGSTPTVAPESVTALGRLRPHSVVTVAGPSRLSVVVANVPVKEGQAVKAGDVVAVLDSAASEEAEVDLRSAELANAQRELDRVESLAGKGIAARADVDRQRTARDVAAAALRKAQAESDLSHVRAPVAGRVLAIHTRAGEKVGADGILEIAEQGPMYAVAEVYETDVPRVRPGQRARVTSPALGGRVLQGTVEKVGLQVEAQRVLGTDPGASRDARVVEVEIRLDDGSVAEDLTGLQVEVMIDVRPPRAGG
ncbi:MAG: efflux RND transporter periplasmic adaptor subunit [Acidobacteriota bacterium]